MTSRACHQIKTYLYFSIQNNGRVQLTKREGCVEGGMFEIVTFQEVSPFFRENVHQVRQKHPSLNAPPNVARVIEQQ